jgi:hypothetical protein
MVIVLAIELKVQSSNPAEDDAFFKGDKIHSTTSFGGGVNPEASCRKILRSVKDPYRYLKRYLVGKILSFLTKFLVLHSKGSAGYCQRPRNLKH